MIIKQVEVEQFEARYAKYQEDWKQCDKNIGYLLVVAEFTNWVSENPHFFMAPEFREYLGVHRLDRWCDFFHGQLEYLQPKPCFQLFSGSSCAWDDVSPDATSPNSGILIDALPDEYEVNLREDDPVFSMYDEYHRDLPSVEELICSARRFADSIVADPKTFVSPTLWTPSSQSAQKETLASAANLLADKVRKERLDLGSLHWRVFEELVTELLRSSGLEVYHVTTSPQGGRDVIARGQLIPGVEPVTFAVEVKHKALVGRPEVQMALQQNAHFPALLFVTSGRFTSGVFSEARLNENIFRLHLWDGVAIGDLIRKYPLQQTQRG